MFKIITSAFFVIVATLAAFGQSETRNKLIAWSSDKTCHKDNQNNEGFALECDSIVIDGTPAYIIDYKGIFVAFSFLDDGKYLIARAYVANNSGDKILVDPTKSIVLHYKIESDYASGGKALNVERALPPDYIADKILFKTKLQNALGELGAGFEKEETKVKITDQNGNEANAVITAPDKQARRDAKNQSNTRTNSANEQAQNVIEAALLPNTVLDKSNIGGLVYFKRNKKAGYTQVWLRVDNILFIFEKKK